MTDQAIKDSIAMMTPQGNRLELPSEQMANYAAVKKILIAAGGKYSKNGFTFALPDCNTKAIQARLVSGEVMNDKKKYQLFETPPDVAKLMVKLADIKIDELVLEPSAGSGNIAKFIKVPEECLTLIELDGNRVAELVSKFKRNRIIMDDFLRYKLNAKNGKFHKIIMNPPFTKGQDIKHIQHAVTLLHPDGWVVAICANGPRQEKVLKPLSTYWEVLAADTFKSEGTNVSTVLGIYPYQKVKK